MKLYTVNILRAFALTLLSLITTVGAFALELSTYTEQSVLADGRWVKISVSETGLYKITRAQLQQWGFNDVSRVHIWGYGGNRIPDRLVADNYVDDLPMVQSVTVDDGIVFYGVGPDKWTKSSNSNNYFRRENNVYTNEGYYFLSDREVEGAPEISAQSTTQPTGTPATTFMDRLHYELDSYSPGEAGYLLVGESFKVQNDRKFNFSAPGRVEGSDAWMECSFVSKTYTNTMVDFYVNGTQLTTVSTDRLNAISNSAYVHGEYIATPHTFAEGGTQIELKISVRNVSVTQNVWLDYISINYKRHLQLPQDGSLLFWSDAPSLKMGGASDGVRVWDVTNPQAITALNLTTSGSDVSWGNDYTGMRSYVAWTPSAKLPQPKLVSKLVNQNLHGMDNVDMVILTLPEYRTQAERIARLHHEGAEPLNVAVINVDEVYNEFSSGMADISGIRKFFKMLYDRSKDHDVSLKYALLIGRATYDNRHLTSQFQGAGAYNTIPYYIGGIPKGQLSDNTAYGTDDFVAMLEDGSGANLGLDDLSIAVGRIPVTSASEAKNVVDKLYQYIQECAAGTWKNSMLFLADDGDDGMHVKQTEAMIAALKDTPAQQNFITKVYVDSYDIVGGVCQGGRDDMYRMLSEGIVWWSFTGHANNHSWTAESMLTYTDINNMYLRKIPVLMAATCDFLRWDSNTISGGEIMYHERNGGVIAAISATRPVYITDNGLFTRAVGSAISLRDDQGRLPRLGDIYRVAKNNILTENGEHRSNPNRLRFVLMGDPAMPMPTPSNIIRIDSVAGVPVGGDEQPTLMALQQTEIVGHICNPAGEVIEDFNGMLQANIYDAERSVTTKGERDDNIKITFEQHGEKLYAGSTAVVNGRFVLKVAMPGEVADNFRPALINMYATTADKRTEAVGVNTDFYVYGYDESVAPDTEAPTIHSMVLNHDSFTNGDAVNDSPMVLAEISDNIGINISGAGIGHQMVLTLDGKRTYNDVSLYYTPSPDGTPSGQIRYPLQDLTAGRHTLTLKVWDTASNSTTQKIDFNVEMGTTPTIFDVYTDVNPASTEVKFYVKHNRPDAELTVTITVYDLLGHTMWETVSKGPSDMFVSAPVTWDLCDTSGRRLPRGIYLYRATISTDNGENYDSATRRLAITSY